MSQTTANVADLAGSIAADAPPASTTDLPSLTGAKDDPAQEGLNNPSPSNGSDIDSAGVPWDASKHAPGRTKKKDGTWRAKTGIGSGSAVKLPQGPPPPPAPPPHLSDAQALVNLVTGACVTIFGNDWKPADAEHASMTEGTRLTLEAYGGFTMPPWAAMGVAFLMYGAARFHLESTKKVRVKLAQRVADFGKDLRTRFARKTSKAENPLVTPGTQVSGQGPKPAPAIDLPPGAEPGFSPSARKI